MHSHREFLAWQRARAVTIEIHRYADSRWSRGRASAIEQVRRSALSTELNLAEGWALGPGARLLAFSPSRLLAFSPSRLLAFSP